MKRIDLGTYVFVFICVVGVTLAIVYLRPTVDSDTSETVEDRRAREMRKARAVMEASNAVLLGAAAESSGDLVECERQYREALSLFLQADARDTRVGEVRVRLAVVIGKDRTRSSEAIVLLNEAMDQFVSQGAVKAANETITIARKVCAELGQTEALASLEQKLTTSLNKQ